LETVPNYSTGRLHRRAFLDPRQCLPFADITL
jgi:hypothetical protein